MGFYGKNENQFCSNQFHLLIQEFFSYGIDDLNFKIGIETSKTCNIFDHSC